MGSVGTYTPEKLVLGVLTSRTDLRADLLASFVEAWGPVDLASDLIPFTWSHYYDGEMGTPIHRFFVSFERLVDPSGLAGIKRETNTLEERWHHEGRRRVNLDPGLVALSRFTLATTKESAHRIPLAHGIYAEITLLWSHGTFRPLEWTYPDYRSESYLEILNHVRALYREQVRGATGTSSHSAP